MLAGTLSAVALAPYASLAAAGRGRLHDEPESATRTAFQRDRDRVIHSTAFRRLMFKTQVFVHHEGDHYRTRLTHSIEVAQIARSLARVLAVDEDLTEALALAHDLGHPPFGHAGEEALDGAMAAFGGFDHNRQALRVVTALEARYPTFDGLNLTWETLEGLAKHNGPVTGGLGSLGGDAIAFIAGGGPGLASFAAVEAQVAALADDIAYCNHDIDDGLRAGLFTVADVIAEAPIAGPIFAAVRARYPGLAAARLIHEAIRRMIGAMVTDALGETRARLAAAAPGSADAVRRLDHSVVAFSTAMTADVARLKDFLFAHMYRHPRVGARTRWARRLVADLFAALFTDPARLPGTWCSAALEADESARARLVADYIAGMTDRYATREHARLAGLDPD